jgi:hypothetical protein
MDKIAEMNKVGQRIFHNPQSLLSYETLVKRSLGPNTYRGFHKIDKSKSGAKDAFEKILIANSNFIIDTLKVSKTEKELDTLENDICKALKEELKKNIRNEQLISFNKLRKPIDIFIEHLIAMETNFSSVRQNLTKHMFLPLDSQMFQSDFVFSDKERQELKIKKEFTFKDILEQSHYNEIQEFLKQKANLIGLENKIYFDLEWNDRWKSNGNNLFETNPKPKK